MRGLGQLDLGHVAAVSQHDLGRLGQGGADVVGEASRHQAVLAPPDEQRRRPQQLEPGPEAVRPVRRLEVDLASGRIEGDAGAARAVGAQELIGGDVGHRGIDALRAGDHSPETLAHVIGTKDRRQHPQLRAQEADQRHQLATAPERHRRGKQAQSPHPARRSHADLQCNPPAHRVAHQIGALDRQGVHQAQHVAGEEAGVIGGQRLGGGAEAGQIDRVHRVVGRECRHGLIEGALGAAQAVDEDRVPGAVSSRQAGDPRAAAPAPRGAAAAAGGRREV